MLVLDVFDTEEKDLFLEQPAAKSEVSLCSSDWLGQRDATTTASTVLEDHKLPAFRIVSPPQPLIGCNAPFSIATTSNAGQWRDDSSAAVVWMAAGGAGSAAAVPQLPGTSRYRQFLLPPPPPPPPPRSPQTPRNPAISLPDIRGGLPVVPIIRAATMNPSLPHYRVMGETMGTNSYAGMTLATPRVWQQRFTQPPITYGSVMQRRTTDQNGGDLHIDYVASHPSRAVPSQYVPSYPEGKILGSGALNDTMGYAACVSHELRHAPAFEEVGPRISQHFCPWRTKQSQSQQLQPQPVVPLPPAWGSCNAGWMNSAVTANLHQRDLYVSVKNCKPKQSDEGSDQVYDVADPKLDGGSDQLHDITNPNNGCAILSSQHLMLNDFEDRSCQEWLQLSQTLHDSLEFQEDASLGAMSSSPSPVPFDLGDEDPFEQPTNLHHSLDDGDQESRVGFSKDESLMLAEVPASGVKIMAKRRLRRSKTFPEKLMDALTHLTNDEVLAWMPDGRSFVVVNTAAFIEQILRRRFKEAKYASFIRKLHRWGFMRLTSSRTRTDCFYHPMFQRGEKKLVSEMTCSLHQRDRDGSAEGPWSYDPPSLTVLEKFVRQKELFRSRT